MHSHYWLSGQVGALARDRWSVPLVHSMHTMAKVKNAALADGDTPEPAARVIGEEQVVEAADMLIANTDIEAKQLIELYDADPARVEVVHPGVDLDVFRPSDVGPLAGSACPQDAVVLLFAGRIQPLKAPDVLLRAVAVPARPRPVAAVPARRPGRRRARPAPASSTPSRSPSSPTRSASPTWCASCRRWPSRCSLDWYAAATLVCVPSYNESFGLVAVEAQAAGTPVVAAAVGGLTTVVRDGVSGLLVEGHDPTDYARAMERIIAAPDLRAELSRGAVAQAASFAWERTADRTLEVYRAAARSMRDDLAGRPPVRQRALETAARDARPTPT